MNPTEDHLDVLQNIEFAVVQVWRQHPEATNYTVMRAYEAAIAQYHGQARGLETKAGKLTGLDATVFEAVKRMCEFRLGREKPAGLSDLQPLSLEDLVACLRKLRKSVDHWSKRGGRQAYLEFIAKFVP
jgi:hypothetical protein